MGKMIPAVIMEPEFNLDVTEMEKLFLVYGNRKDQASLEGLGKMASNIAISFGDFVIKVGNNIKVGITGQFKDIKRSSLRILFNANKLGMMRVANADYSTFVTMECAKYPFTVAPKEVIGFCKDNFGIIDMEKRIVNLIDNYMQLGALIRINDINGAINCIEKINMLNIRSKMIISQQLMKMVTPPSGSNRSQFGEVFDSMSEFNEVNTLTLAQAEELDVAMKVTKQLDLLYRSFDKITSAITEVAETNFDLSKLSGIATIVNDTGILIEQYAMLVKEYHHLEWFLTTTCEEALKLMKK